MSTAKKLYQDPNALKLEGLLNELVLAFNLQRQSILNGYHVTELEVDIISYLNDEEQKKMKEVGEYFNIKLSTLTSTIDKLEKNKLVKRKNSKEDRRVIYIRPTAKGLNLLTELSQTMNEISEVIARSLKQNEFDSLVKGLDRILEFTKSKK
ncbi:MAG: MarR family transcriptional regulator [Bacteroidota bacterium]